MYIVKAAEMTFVQKIRTFYVDEIGYRTISTKIIHCNVVVSMTFGYVLLNSLYL